LEGGSEVDVKNAKVRDVYPIRSSPDRKTSFGL